MDNRGRERTPPGRGGAGQGPNRFGRDKGSAGPPDRDFRDVDHRQQAGNPRREYADRDRDLRVNDQEQGFGGRVADR